MPNIHIEEILPDLYLLRVDDDLIKYFEALWEIPEGITYNAYLLKTSEGAVLFDTWRQRYSDEFIEAVKKIIDPKDIKYIVVHHMEPDHSGSLPRILEENGYKATVIGHPIVKQMIKSFYHIEPRFQPIKDGDKIIIGGKTLEFVTTPWLHWPDTIMTYIHEYKILLTCDVFGSYGIPPTIFDDDEEYFNGEYLLYAKKYLITVVGHYKEHIIRNLDKLKTRNLEIEAIAPSHGLVLRKHIDTMIKKYIDWAKGVAEKNKIVVIYSSMYGFVEEAVNTAIKELRDRGYSVKTYRFTDTIHSSIADILSDIVDAEALILATATYEANVFPLVNYVVDEIIEKTKYPKPVIIISSYGWGGIAARKLSEKLEKAGFKIVNKVEFRGKIDEAAKEAIKESIRKIEETIMQKH